VFSLFHRYGVTNVLNIGARAEGSDGIYNGGTSLSFLAPRGGAFTISLAGSAADGSTGAAGSFQHSYQLGNFNTNLLLRGFSKDYATVGNPPSSDVTRYEMSFGVGFLLMPLGSVSLNYSERDTHSGLNTQVMTASYSRELTKSTSLFVTASNTRQVDTTFSFFIGLNFNFEKGIRGAAQYTRAGSADTETLQLQKDIPVGEGLGYRASLNRNDMGTTSTNSFNPYLQYNAKYGIYSIDSNILNSSDSTSETYNISAAGSLVYAGGFY
jgi:outer membrane usher protein FimD/PapC